MLLLIKSDLSLANGAADKSRVNGVVDGIKSIHRYIECNTNDISLAFDPSLGTDANCAGQAQAVNKQ